MKINIPKRDNKNKLHYYKDLKDMKYGKLTALKYLYTNHRRKAVWLCQCECGNFIEVPSERLSTGNTRSCGCLHIDAIKENIKKAQKAQTKYKTEEERDIAHKFSQMRSRCYNEKSKAYKNYGGRGINIYDDWLNDTNAFIKWSLNNGYKIGLSIDRIDVNGNYEPNNCRWVDNLTQQNNKRNNRYLTYKGETHTLSEWSRITKIPTGTIKDRLRRNYSVENVLNTNYIRKV